MPSISENRSIKLRRAVLALATFATTSVLAQAPETRIPVTVAPLASVTSADRRAVSAEVTARHRAQLAAEVTGRVVQLDVDVGDSVDKGAVLLRIDPTLYELALRRAEADLASVNAEIKRAESRLSRISALAQKDYASEDELQVESTSLEVLRRTRERRRVERDQARVDLARTRVLAPFDGIVEARRAQLGNYVAPGTSLFTLTERADREVRAALHPDQAGALPDATRLQFTSSEGASDLRLLRLSPVIDPVTRMQAVRLAFVDAPQAIGTLGELRWQSARGRLPSDFVLQRDGRFGVFVVDGNTAKFVELPDAVQGRPARHTLPSNTQLVNEGRQRLQDGDAIRITQP